MEQKLNRFFLIVFAGIAFETGIILLCVFIRDLFPLMIISFFATYPVMLYCAKRAGIFDETSFLQALLFSLLMSIPVTLLPPAIVVVGASVITQQVPNTDWIPNLQGLSILFIVKIVFAAIVAFIFCTRLEAIIGLSDEKELELYGATTQGVIYRKWQYRHLCFIRAEYHINGTRYETDSKPDRKNLFSENDTVTIIYSTRYPLISTIKELADHNINYASIEKEN
jgi:hypothetical protein